MRDIANIVEFEIAEKMDRNVTVDLISGNDLTVCNPKWAATDKVVYDLLGNEYRITAVDNSAKVITVNPLGAYSFTGATLILNKPHFFTGTPIATNTEWTAKFTDDLRKKTPFIWMVEPTDEVDQTDEDNSLERQSTIRVVFLDQNNHEQWLTKDTHKYRLQALYNMRTEFTNVIKKSLLFEGYSNATFRNLTKFGRETASGFEANIIDANLTGVDSRLTLSIYSTGDCNC